MYASFISFEGVKNYLGRCKSNIAIPSLVLTLKLQASNVFYFILICELLPQLHNLWRKKVISENIMHHKFN